MNLFKKHKDKKKLDAQIIASVEEEDIVYEDAPAAQPAPQPTPEQTQAEAPVQEPEVEEVEEVVEGLEEPVEEIAEETVEEVEEPVEEAETQEEPVVEQEEEVAEQVEAAQEEQEPAEEPVEETTEETVEEVEEVAETAETEQEPQEQVEETAQEENSVEELLADVEDVNPVIIEETPAEEVVEEEVAKEPVYQPTFAEKMNIADEDIQRRYDELKNYALRFKKLTWRISKKYDSINQGRFQFVKLSVAGKTLKLNLNMDIGEADPKYHCVDKRKTKTYEEVPTQMRIKSDRGLKYAKELIDQCAAKHGLVENPKFKPVNSLELIERHLELGDTDDIIFEVADDEE